MKALPGGIQHSEEDGVLISSLHAGSEAAIRVLYNEYANALFFVSFKLVRNKEEAEELVIDTFLTFWNKRTEFGTALHVRNFLFRHIKNRSIDVLRLRKKFISINEEKLAEELIEKSDPLNDMIQAELLKEIFTFLEDLPEKHRVVVDQLIMEGRSAKEVAAYLNTTPGDVYTIHHRVLFRLKEHGIELKAFKRYYCLIFLSTAAQYFRA